MSSRPPASIDTSVERAAARGVRLCVFDFDNCVLRVHSYGLKLTPADVARRDLERDFADLSFFRALVLALRRRGVAVAIASFGSYEVIQAFLDRAFADADAAASLAAQPARATTADPLTPAPAQQVFTRDNISTPSSVGGTDGFTVPGGKNRQLEQLAARFGANADATLFFDDDDNNIGLAAAGAFRHAVLCPRGFGAESWENAMMLLDGSVSVAELRASGGAASRAVHLVHSRAAAR
jgi:hypothetical protein